MFQGRVRSLRRIMRTKDALRLIFPRSKTGELKIYLSLIKRNIVLRRGTSDIWCLEKVFLEQEYKTPFQVDPKVIVDAGANIGMATLFFSQKYPRASIIAIEPEASNFAILTKNCAELPNVTLINAALWPTEQALVIQNSTAEKWAFLVTEREKVAECEPVKAVTIPGLLRQLGVEYIDVLKLDIEGAERELFNIGAESWLGAVGQIIIELHDRFISGCALAFYTKVTNYSFVQEVHGENIFVNFRTRM